MGGNTGNIGEAFLGLYVDVSVIFFSLAAFILFVVAGGVAFGSPFNVLPTIALIIGVIDIVSLVSMLFFFCFYVAYQTYRWIVIIFRSLFYVASVISFPVGIIIIVGFFSLKSSLDVSLFIKPNEEVANIIDDIAQSRKEMKSAGVLLIIGSVFVIVPILYSLVPVCHGLRGDESKVVDKQARAMAVAVVQLLCGLFLFLLLQLFGRAGPAPFGFAGLRNGTYVVLYVLSIAVMVLGVINMVLFKWNQMPPVLIASRVLGVIGCVVSIAMLIYASIVLAERAKAESNIRTFCTVNDGVSPKCNELLTNYKANMCVGEEDGKRPEERGSKAEDGRGKKEEGEEKEEKEGGEESCKEQYKLDALQKKMISSTRGWMGFIGFACMFLAFVHFGISLLVSLCYKSETETLE